MEAGLRRARAQAIQRGELQDCRHGDVFVEWKCRTCCKTATHIYWMDEAYSSHRCESCHKTKGTTTPKIRAGRVVAESLSVCPGAGHCTNEKTHPPPVLGKSSVWGARCVTWRRQRNSKWKRLRRKQRGGSQSRRRWKRPWCTAWSRRKQTRQRSASGPLRRRRRK